jgi:hypothetical protein
MAAIKAHRTITAPFSNERAVYRLRYDFAKDGGATGALDIATASGALIVTHFHSRVVTACTSGGSATLKVGVTGDDDRFANTTQGAVASLTADAVVVPPALEGTPNVLPTPYKMASGDKILQTIGTAALTAGVVEYVIEVMAP